MCGTIEPQVCSSCRKLPLTYASGPALITMALGLTVTPIYRAPSGGRYVFPAGLERIIDGYVANVAAERSSANTVYSIDTQYYKKVGGTKT